MTKPQDIFKFCMKCGSSSFIFNDSNFFECQTCKFKFFINSASAVAAVIPNEKAEILLTKRKKNPAKGTLDIPGGFVDPMETAENALRREIKEELNLDLIQHQYLMSIANDYVYSGLSIYTTDLVYICQVKNLNTIKIADDITDFVFIHPKDINIKSIGLHSIRKLVKFLKKNGL